MKRRFEEKPAAPGDHDVPAAPVRPDFTPGVDVIHRVWNTPYVFGDLTFHFVAEGAGYENTFGWYNAGDDVSNPANRATPWSSCTT